MAEKPNDPAGGSINPDEVVSVDINEIPDESAPPEKVQLLKKGVQTLSAQKKHWRDEAIDPATGRKYKDILAEQGKINNPAPKQQDPNDAGDDISKRLSTLELEKEKRQFGYENNLSPEETDRVFIFAQGANKQPKDVLSDPFIKSGLASLRATNKTSSATPRPSSRAPVVEGKSFNQLDETGRRENWTKITGAK